MTAYLVHELERVFDILNEKLFFNNLSRPNFMLQPKKKGVIRWSPIQKCMIIGSEFANLEFSDLPVILLHEMVHVANYQKGVNDCTSNQYHNKYFLELALQVGLIVIKHKTQGWSVTTTAYPRNVIEREFVNIPSKEAFARRQETFNSIKIDKAIFRRGKSYMRSKIKEDKLTAKTYFLKYVCNCPAPHNSIRSGRRPDGPNALNIQCMKCHSRMVCISISNEVE